jgi:hypothetical protein
MLRLDSKLNRFKLIVKPDLSDASLHVINTSGLTLHNFKNVSFQSYRICEDTLVSIWRSYDHKFGVYTGLTTAHFTSDIAWIARDDHSICPASGRIVYFAYSDDDDNDDGRIVIIDLI